MNSLTPPTPPPRKHIHLFLFASPQVLLVLFGTIYFGDPVGLVNGLGILVVVIGSFKYGLVTIQEKQEK